MKDSKEKNAKKNICLLFSIYNENNGNIWNIMENPKII